MERRLAKAQRELARAQAAKEFDWRRLVEFFGLMLAITIVMLAFTFKSEHDSCERQKPVREAANARRLVVNALVDAAQTTQFGTEKQRINLAVMTAAIPPLEELNCGLPWPDY